MAVSIPNLYTVTYGDHSRVFSAKSFDSRVEATWYAQRVMWQSTVGDYVTIARAGEIVRTYTRNEDGNATK